MRSKFSFIIAVVLAFAVLIAMLTAGDMKETRINIKGMKCQNCVTKVSDGLISVKGVKTVEVDLIKGVALVKHNSSNLQDLENAVLSLGFEANGKLPKMSHEEFERRELKAGKDVKAGSCNDELKAGNDTKCCSSKNRNEDTSEL